MSERIDTDSWNDLVDALRGGNGAAGQKLLTKMEKIAAQAARPYLRPWHFEEVYVVSSARFLDRFLLKDPSGSYIELPTLGARAYFRAMARNQAIRVLRRKIAEREKGRDEPHVPPPPTPAPHSAAFLALLLWEVNDVFLRRKDGEPLPYAEQLYYALFHPDAQGPLPQAGKSAPVRVSERDRARVFCLALLEIATFLTVPGHFTLRAAGPNGETLDANAVLKLKTNQLETSKVRVLTVARNVAQEVAEDFVASDTARGRQAWVKALCKGSGLSVLETCIACCHAYGESLRTTATLFGSTPDEVQKAIERIAAALELSLLDDANAEENDR